MDGERQLTVPTFLRPSQKRFANLRRWLPELLWPFAPLHRALTIPQFERERRQRYQRREVARADEAQGVRGLRPLRRAVAPRRSRSSSVLLWTPSLLAHR